MSDALDSAEKNWRQGDTRSAEFILIQEVKRIDKELNELKDRLVPVVVPVPSE